MARGMKDAMGAFARERRKHTAELVALIAACPVQDFYHGSKDPERRPDSHPIYGMNDWLLTMGDVRKARKLLQP